MIRGETCPIVLLTDFGSRDAFAGVLKGVIASISPDARVMDLTHGIDPQNILQAAFVLTTSYAYFPRRSIFCVVVDPGVGSCRKPICIATRDYFFVGPDNGVLWNAATSNTITQMVHLTHTKYFLDSLSSTFHGRDIFAPVAAHISKGPQDLSRFGTPMETCVEYPFPEIKKTGVSLGLTVLHVDWFGNVVLNLTQEEFNRFVQNRGFCLTLKGICIKKRYNAYCLAADNEIFLIGSSSSHMEISVKNASAAKMLDASPMDTALLEVLSP